MTNRWAVFASILFAIASVASALTLKYHVQSRAERAEALAHQIAADLEAIRVLKAEWAYLSSPQRVQERSVKFLALMPPTPSQILTSIEDIPFRIPSDQFAGGRPAPKSGRGKKPDTERQG